MRLDELLDIERLNVLIAGGLVAEFRHPTEPLRLLDYTRRAQGRRAWEPTTEMCRGLIVADDGTVVARPFPRMPSVEELAAPPVGPFDADEKLDGSLVIHYGDGQFATRRSFVSPQARMAALLWAQHAEVEIPREQTWVFELIHPANRNIVDYGARRELVLVGALDIETGREVEAEGWTGSTPARWSDVPSLDALPPSDGEGFVLTLPDGTRLKCKTDWYRRVETAMNRTTELTIWEFLRADKSLETVTADAPPAFVTWVADVASRFRTRFIAVERESRAAAYAKMPRQARHAHVAYKMAAGRPYADVIWRAIKPRSPQRFHPQVEEGPEPGRERRA